MWQRPSTASEVVRTPDYGVVHTPEHQVVQTGRLRVVQSNLAADSWLDTECSSYTLQCPECDVAFAAFHRADIRPVEPTLIRQGLLGQAGRSSQCPDVRCHNAVECAAHGRLVPSLLSLCLQTEYSGLMMPRVMGAEFQKYLNEDIPASEALARAKRQIDALYPS